LAQSSLIVIYRLCLTHPCVGNKDNRQLAEDGWLAGRPLWLANHAKECPRGIRKQLYFAEKLAESSGCNVNKYPPKMVYLTCENPVLECLNSMIFMYRMFRKLLASRPQDTPFFLLFSAFYKHISFIWREKRG